MIILSKCLFIVVGLYFLAGLLIYLNQYKLLYVPHTYDLEEAQAKALDNQFTLWPTQDAQYLGLLSDPQTQECQGTVLLFHGNAGSAMSRTYYSDMLTHLGYRVILVEYPGYGAKPGDLGETSLVSAGCQAVEQAYTQFAPPVYLMAESLGCGVACAVARDATPKVAGLLLITPWDTLPNLAQRRYPIFPTHYLSKDQYHNIDNLKHFTSPIGIVTASLDEVIPTEHAENMIKHLQSDHQVWRLTNVGHTDWFNAVDMAWWRDVMAYLTRSTSSSNTPSSESL